MSDNLAIARVLAETADLLELKEANPFKIRAYRNAAETIANTGERVAAFDEARLRELPGVGRDLAARIREIVETGDAGVHRELVAEFPPTILELLHLQGVGPKTAATVYRELGIGSLDDLERAARAGQLASVRGMGPKKTALILRAIDERRRHASRYLAPEVADTAAALIARLQEAAPGADFTPVGSLRRGAETCGDLDILAVGAPPSLMDAFTGDRLVERVLGRGETKASVLLHGGLQADLRLVPPGSRGAALQYFTGSKAHNIALRDRALARGLTLNEYGLFDAATSAPVASETEEAIYAALGLPFVPPELRENRGEIDAAAAGSLPRLIERSDLRGDLHAHTTATDGRDDIETMALAARAAGLEYLAITDHSQALAMANGLDERRALAHAARVREVGRRLDGITLLAGIECDIRPDGTMDLADDCLAELDLVIASVHSAFNQEASQMTDRLRRAIACPYVDIIGHPTGRLLLRREPYQLDLDAVLHDAAAAGVALEINSQIERRDLNDVQARLARDRGITLTIATDAHARGAFSLLRWGVQTARRAWLTADDVLNTRPIEAFRASLRRHRRPAAR
ncbi:MAG: DNA polymerase/3'-5' exonuclease PolX [Acidobacteriota bacterium]|nr:DNA polymerase/3'-5' exonuclease PolX [Acidobacteriota bacterium]